MLYQPHNVRIDSSQLGYILITKPCIYGADVAKLCPIKYVFVSSEALTVPSWWLVTWSACAQ